LARATAAIAGETTGKAIERKTMTEVLVLLRGAGIRISTMTLNATMKTGAWVAENPLSAGLITTALFCKLYPEKAKDIIDNGGKWVSERLQEIAKEMGRASLGMPGNAIGAIWDKASELADRHPMGALVFYLLAAVLTAFVVVFPILLLKYLFPEAFHLLKSTLRLFGASVTRVYMILRSKRHSAR